MIIFDFKRFEKGKVINSLNVDETRFQQSFSNSTVGVVVQS